MIKTSQSKATFKKKSPIVHSKLSKSRKKTKNIFKHLRRSIVKIQNTLE